MADQTDLQKIEEWHATAPWGDAACPACKVCDQETPCDVVKLARALSDIMEDSRGYDAPINRGLNSIQNAERVLREVANG